MTKQTQNRKFKGSSPSSNGGWFTDEILCALTRGLHMPPGNKAPARWPELDERDAQPVQTPAPTGETGSKSWMTILFRWFKTRLPQNATRR